MATTETKTAVTADQLAALRERLDTAWRWGFCAGLGTTMPHAKREYEVGTLMNDVCLILGAEPRSAEVTPR